MSHFLWNLLCYALLGLLVLIVSPFLTRVLLGAEKFREIEHDHFFAFLPDGMAEILFLSFLAMVIVVTGCAWLVEKVRAFTFLELSPLAVILAPVLVLAFIRWIHQPEPTTHV